MYYCRNCLEPIDEDKEYCSKCEGLEHNTLEEEYSDIFQQKLYGDDK